MKTITLKADEQFDEVLTRLARQLNTTKSAVLRTAVLSYQKQLEQKALRQRIREASFKTRQSAIQAASDLEASNADGL